jgi:ribosomal protein L37AE/L43A
MVEMQAELRGEIRSVSRQHRGVIWCPFCDRSRQDEGLDMWCDGCHANFIDGVVDRVMEEEIPAVRRPRKRVETTENSPETTI